MNVLTHLRERHLNPSLYRCSWDDETACFLLFNLSGEVAGYHHYRPFGDKKIPNSKEGRYYTHATNYDPVVWGLDACDFTRSNVLFLVEGMFDACRLHNLNLNAVATLSNHPVHLRNWLFCLPVLTVALLDNDAPGKKLATVSQLSFVTPAKDLGEMTDDEVKKFMDVVLNDLPK